MARLTPVAESGSQAEDEIRLSWLDAPIIAAGDAIDAESLAAIEGAAETAVASANDRFGATKLARRREADQEAMGLEEERASQIAGAREHYQQRADDLTTLELHQLLSEPRYQQLSHTCGEVFRAGIGAEAVVELIGNVDLDALAAELREEIESPSIQRAKEGHQAPQGRRSVSPLGQPSRVDDPFRAARAAAGHPAHGPARWREVRDQ